MLLLLFLWLYVRLPRGCTVPVLWASSYTSLWMPSTASRPDAPIAVRRLASFLTTAATPSPLVSVFSGGSPGAQQCLGCTWKMSDCAQSDVVLALADHTLSYCQDVCHDWNELKLKVFPLSFHCLSLPPLAFSCRCLSLSLSVFVVLGTCIAVQLGTHPGWMFFCCFAGMFMFYCAHWQTYVSGTLRFGM